MQNLRWRFLCKWFTKGVLLSETYEGTKEAGQGREETEQSMAKAVLYNMANSSHMWLLIIWYVGSG